MYGTQDARRESATIHILRPGGGYHFRPQLRPRIGPLSHQASARDPEPDFEYANPEDMELRDVVWGTMFCALALFWLTVITSVMN